MARDDGGNERWGELEGGKKAVALLELSAESLFKTMVSMGGKRSVRGLIRLCQKKGRW